MSNNYLRNIEFNKWDKWDEADKWNKKHRKPERVKYFYEKSLFNS